MDERDESFLTRWSRLKQESRQKPAPAVPTPSEAAASMTYAYPAVTDLGMRVKIALATYREAGRQKARRENTETPVSKNNSLLFAAGA